MFKTLLYNSSSMQSRVCLITAHVLCRQRTEHSSRKKFRCESASRRLHQTNGIMFLRLVVDILRTRIRTTKVAAEFYPDHAAMRGFTWPRNGHMRPHFTSLPPLGW